MRGLVFDLDGTLVDTVYPHILAWQRAFVMRGIEVDASLLHPLIGLSGDLLVKAVARELRRSFSPRRARRLDHDHLQIFKQLARVRLPLPGAPELLRHLQRRRIRHGIASSGTAAEIAPSLESLGLHESTVVVDADQVTRPKPASDPVLACVAKLQIPREQCYLVGDTAWDQLAAQRAGMCGLALLTGGRGADELAHAGAQRVFRDPRALLGAIQELGLR